MIHPLREEGIEPTSSAWKADDVTVYPHPPNYNLFFARVLCIHFWAACKNILEPQKSKVRSPSTHTWENQAGTTFEKVSQDIRLAVFTKAKARHRMHATLFYIKEQKEIIPFFLKPYEEQEISQESFGNNGPREMNTFMFLHECRNRLTKLFKKKNCIPLYKGVFTS